MINCSERVAFIHKPIIRNHMPHSARAIAEVNNIISKSAYIHVDVAHTDCEMVAWQSRNKFFTVMRVL